MPPIEFEREDPTLAEYDWVVTYAGDFLHAPARHIDDDEWWDGDGVENLVTACGRTLKHPSIPGIFTRMGAKRCDRCCDNVGYPRGVGSPKNDDAIRKIRGWR